MDLLDIQGVTLGGGGTPVGVAFSTDILQGLTEWLQARIISEFPLSDLGIASAEVVIRKWPWDDKRIYPGITIHPVDDMLGIGSCVEDNVGYGIGITYVRHTDRGLENYLPMMRFRAQVRGSFNHRQPAELASFWKLTVEMGQFAVPSRYRDSNDVSAMVVRGWSEEERDF